MAVETDRAGKARGVVVEQANADGDTQNQWSVPLLLDNSETVTGRSTTADVISLAKPPVEVGPPEVGVKEEKKEENLVYRQYTCTARALFRIHLLETALRSESKNMAAQ